MAVNSDPRIINEKVKVNTPYFHRSASQIPFEQYVERFDFQIEENGKVGRVSLGVFDVVKEVQSHNGEAGLINVLKLAEARGLGLDAFMKKEPGFMIDLSGVDTMDDLIQKQEVTNSKLDAFAKDLGITTDQLVKIIQSGNYSELKPAEKTGEDKKDGE